MEQAQPPNVIRGSRPFISSNPAQNISVIVFQNYESSIAWEGVFMQLLQHPLVDVIQKPNI